MRIERAGSLAQPPGRLVAIGAVDQHEAELHFLGQREQVLHQLERERVGPLQVVDDDAQRALLGEAPHDLRHGGERLLLHGLAAQLAQGGVGLGLERLAEQAREERIGRFRIARELAERGLQLEPDARLRRIDADAEPVAQEVAHRPVGEVLGVRAGPALEEADAIAEAPAGLDDESRLADARLARDREDRAAAVGDRLAGALEHGQLAAAPDQRHERAHLRRSSRARDARGTQRPLEPSQLDLAERLELEAELHLALGLGTDDDAALGGQLLQARRDVRGIAERVVALGSRRPRR